MALVKKYFVYRTTDNVCVNVVVWDGENEYNLDDGLSIEIVPAGSFASIGWVRQPDGEWIEPVIETPA